MFESGAQGMQIKQEIWRQPALGHQGVGVSLPLCLMIAPHALVQA